MDKAPLTEKYVNALDSFRDVLMDEPTKNISGHPVTGYFIGTLIVAYAKEIGAEGSFDWPQFWTDYGNLQLSQ
jgi:hypothetical protein